VSEGEPPEGPAESVAGRLDPDSVVAAHEREVAPHPPPIIDTRPYRWMIGIFGLVLVIAISIYQFASHGIGTPGVAAGQRLHFFVAPLATSHLNLPANANPRCDPAHPNRQGLNVCGRTPIVLAFFAIGSGDCERQVGTLQALSREFAASAVQFAAVAVRGGPSETAKLVRKRGWTIPVGYDEDGRIGDIYGIAVCPIVELAYRGGIVAQRLIGNHWVTAAALRTHVQAMLAHRA
jgi:thiol-disulfide isomerase/thioredoxin